MMKNIYVLAEHRKGALRDTTWEAIAAGRKLSSDLGAELVCVLLANNAAPMAEQLAGETPRVLVVDNPVFQTMNSEAVIKTLQGNTETHWVLFVAHGSVKRNTGLGSRRISGA